MIERNDDDVRGIAMAAFDEFERSVTGDETERALASVHARIADGGAESLPPLPVGLDSQRRTNGWMLGAAAAVVALMIGGLVVVSGRSDEESSTLDQGLPPVTQTQTTAAPTVESTIVDAGEPAPSTTIAPTTIAPAVADTVPVVAETAPITSVAPPSADIDQLAISRRCLDEYVCTDLGSTDDGRIVAFDPTDNTLRIYNSQGTELLSEVPIDQDIPDPFPDSDVGAWPVIEHVGPDDVVYLSYYAVGNGDAMRDLIAVPLDGPSAGAVVDRWDGLDGSGDSDLVPTRTGLAVVGCCGFDLLRPSPDATVFGFVDRTGAPIESGGPVFRLELGDAGNQLVRTDANGDETRFALPTIASFPRGMPRLAAADDGGAGMSLYSIQFNQSFVVDFDTDWPEYDIDPADVVVVDDAVEISLLEPAGTFLVADGDGFVRHTIDEIGDAGWPGRAEVDTDAGATTAPGLNDHIAANQPTWAADPILLGLQISPAAGPNESIDIQFDDATSTLTITVSGFLDDSAEGAQRVIQLERDSNDGLWRFVSGTYGWKCQPGRGHQDYSTEYCV